MTVAGAIYYATITAVGSGGNAVAALPSEVYPRKLHSVTVTAPRGSRVEFYLGAVAAGSRFDQSSRGDSNTADYSTPRPIPPGTPILVSWPGQSANADSCLATFAVSKG
jgi:hypothetical protein